MKDSDATQSIDILKLNLGKCEFYQTQAVRSCMRTCVHTYVHVRMFTHVHSYVYMYLWQDKSFPVHIHNMNIQPCSVSVNIFNEISSLSTGK